MKTTLAAAAALAAALVSFQPATAEARNGWVAGAVIGTAGALVVGSALANAQPSTVYVRRACWRERREVYNRFGEFRGYRTVRVCR